jgi:hypothetical protein
MDWKVGQWGTASRVLALGAGIVLVACSEPPREEEAVEQPTVGNSNGDSGSGNGSASGTTSGSASATSGAADSSTGDDEIKLDVGQQTTGQTTANPDGDQGCKKVDFLFIIDNSGSMGDEQDNLIASFPGFIDTIQNTLDEAQDYHIMVLDSDPWVYEGCQGACDSGCLPDGCGLPPAFECILPCALSLTCIGQYTCGVTTPFECEDVLGAGVTYPRGSQSSNQDCNFSTGARYMDSSEPDLAATFGCAADVGTGSTAGTEKPMEAMVQAVTPGTEAFGCNEGFIRDDAILVVTFVTDEDDSNDSAGTVEGWRQALIAAKGGDETAVVVLGLFGDNDQPGAICPPLDEDSNDGAEPSEKLRSFVDSWGPRGFAGSVCAPSYNDFFQEAVNIIDNTCEDFTPPEG